MDLARIAWLLTVIACLIAVLILALDKYYGYAGVTLAVAISAAINLRQGSRRPGGRGPRARGG